MRRNRNIKIVATLGPASNDYATIKALHVAGGGCVSVEHEPRIA